MLTTVGFASLYPYLGLWGTLFIQTVFYIIIVRIGIAFVFKLLRRNVDYNTPVRNSGYSKTVNAKMDEVVRNTPRIND